MAVAIDRGVAPPPYSGFDCLPIGGEWRSGRDAEALKDHDPYNGETLLEIPRGTREDLDDAYQAAAQAQREWAEALPAERAAVLRNAAEVVDRRQDEIVSWLIHESGSTRIKAQLECEFVRGVMLEASTLPHIMAGKIMPSDIPGKESRVYRKPVGVVGVISPWNWPLQLSNRSVAPALAVGNTVVLKPASDTPVTGGLLLAKIYEEAGLPPGVLNVIVGAGSEIGDAFVCHPVPRAISFTGSTSVGRHIAKGAADAPLLKRVELELGGNGPFVVLDDADLERAVEAAVVGKFLHQGQICMIVNRFIVDDTLYEPFVERFAERVRALKVGDPDKADTVIGPIINQSQFDSLIERIRGARDAGVREVVGGEPDGLVLPPHVFADVRNDMPVAQEELFGPVAPIIRAKNEDEALALANDTMQGLSGAVFSGDAERGLAFAQRMEVGMAHVNDHPVNDMPFSPFGGVKNSGIGRFNGEWAVAAFTTDQWISVQHKPRPAPF
ncbi:MAG TPA: aldehyde dehydrogenase family protein [Gammaproteobacteria bacterium]|nr:aldehyde dehydrogenase family protein [Gammaproteobacteria bacterium]